MMRLLITGSRDWSRADLIHAALDAALSELVTGPADIVTLVHGACPTGADAIAAAYWSQLGLPVEAHPADWIRHGRAAGPVRNAMMVNAGADLCLAFPKGASRGTRGCLRLAQQAGIPVRVLEG